MSSFVSSSIVRRLCVVSGLAVAGLTAGCAAETAGWPQMNDFSRITQKVLTPQEQDQAVKSMTAEQQAEQAKALKTIEKK